MNLHSNIQIETEDLWHVEFQPMITHSAAMVPSWLSSLGGGMCGCQGEFGIL